MHDETAGDFTVAGFRFAGVAAGIKKKPGLLDVGLIVAERPVLCAGVFTTNLVVAAPVVHSRALLAETAGYAQAVVANSGCANACTGESGLADARRMSALVAERIGAGAAQVQVCSTGVIGADLPMDKIAAGIAQAAEQLSEDGLPAFARAIMTTDTRPKFYRRQAQIGGRTITVAGASKGAGMIHPNMATMLAFVLTDAGLEGLGAAQMAALWRRVCKRSFNAITVDGDTSTNDTALLLASGAAGELSADDLPAFEALLEGLAVDLAKAIVRDAEGATCLVALTVSGAAEGVSAHQVAQTIALSPLVKTALHGQDPNWGRIIAAAGRAGVAFEPEALRLWIGPTLLFAQGRWQGAAAEAAVRETMRQAEYAIRLDLGQGAASHTLYTCDLSADYVRINADYRS